MTNLAPVLMVQAAAASVGKSTLVAGLCRLFLGAECAWRHSKRRTCPTTPPSAQAAGEIGRAQYAQAIAASISMLNRTRGASCCCPPTRFEARLAVTPARATAPRY